MEKEGLFKLLIVVVLCLIVLVILNVDMADMLGISDEQLSDAEKFSIAMDAANAVCPNERMSGMDTMTVESQSGTQNLEYLILEDDFTCDVGDTEAESCIILFLERKQKVLDSCIEDGGTDYGNFEFAVTDPSTGDIYHISQPNCKGEDVYGCCVKGEKKGEWDWACEWSNYKMDFFGDVKSLNIVVPNSEDAHLWSNFTSMRDDGSSEHICYGGEMKHDNHDYKSGELGMTYTLCCPEEWKWNNYHGKCCSDDECTNILCMPPAHQEFGVCWVGANPGENCDDACAALGKTCSPEKLEKALEGGMLDNCDLHVHMGYLCGNCEEAPDVFNINSYSPYHDTSTGDCYYQNDTATNSFDCSVSDPNFERICPCKMTGETTACNHMTCPAGMCCEDDGGQVYNLRGCALDDDEELRDFCTDSSGGISFQDGTYSDYVRETYCDPVTGEVETEVHLCGPSRCLDGVCI